MDLNQEELLYIKSCLLAVKDDTLRNKALEEYIIDKINAELI